MLPELKIAQLRYFVLVAELKSFHAAARQAFAPSRRYPWPCVNWSRSWARHWSRRAGDG